MATLFDMHDVEHAQAGVAQAHAALGRGEVVLVPTDTVYGLAVSPAVPGAVDRVLAVKGRGRQMAPPILVSSIDQLEGLVAPEALTEGCRRLLQRFWPGALTVIVPAHPDHGIDLGDTPGTVAVRSPHYDPLLELIRVSGPLAVTSANKTGEQPVRSASEAINVFGDEVSVYLNAGADTETDHVPSTIVDATAFVTGEGALRLIRKGAISAEELEQAGFEVEAS